MEEKIKALKKFTELLKENGIDCALGGSGMLYALGLVETFGDWDLITEASFEELEPILKNYTHEKKSSSGIYASNFICYVDLKNIKMDLISGFRIKKPDGAIAHIQTKSVSSWNNIRLADPIEWLEAYRLMGRTDKVQILENYIRDI